VLFFVLRRQSVVVMGFGGCDGFSGDRESNKKIGLKTHRRSKWNMIACGWINWEYWRWHSSGGRRFPTKAKLLIKLPYVVVQP